MKISILFATCGRNELFRDALISCLNTSRPHEIEIVAVIDDEFENVKTMSYAWADEFIIDYSPRRRGALWAWNRALQISTGYILIPAGDDQIFHPNWLDYALESHQSKLGGYGVLGMNDLAYNGDKGQTATMFLFDRKYCKEVMGGVFAPPMYHYYCIDSEWNEKAKQLHHFYWDERSKVEHLHSAHNKRPKDDLDSEKEVDNWMELDNKTFEDRKNMGFPITWQPII